MTKQTRALIVIDVQRGFDDANYCGPRDNPKCEENIHRLIKTWRAAELPVIFVRHDSQTPGSPLAPGQSGNEFKSEVSGAPDFFVTKKVNSAFYGTPNLESWLRTREIKCVAICGITTNHCCETTARMSGNLGFDTWFVIDATHTFDRKDVGGKTVSAAELSRITATNLDGEFAKVLSTEQAIELAKPIRDGITGRSPENNNYDPADDRDQ
jgi:nicotinamidase-related amidase